MGQAESATWGGPRAGYTPGGLLGLAALAVLVLALGLVLLGVTVGEVVATVLFVPVFAAGLLGGRKAGYAAASVATVAYLGTRAGDLSGAGVASAGVMVLTRAAAFAVAGHVGALVRVYVDPSAFAGDVARSPVADRAGREAAGVPSAVEWRTMTEATDPWETRGVRGEPMLASVGASGDAASFWAEEAGYGDDPMTMSGGWPPEPRPEHAAEPATDPWPPRDPVERDGEGYAPEGPPRGGPPAGGHWGDDPRPAALDDWGNPAEGWREEDPWGVPPENGRGAPDPWGVPPENGRGAPPEDPWGPPPENGRGAPSEDPWGVPPENGRGAPSDPWGPPPENGRGAPSDPWGPPPDAWGAPGESPPTGPPSDPWGVPPDPATQPPGPPSPWADQSGPWSSAAPAQQAWDGPAAGETAPVEDPWGAPPADQGADMWGPSARPDDTAGAPPWPGPNGPVDDAGGGWPPSPAAGPVDGGWTDPMPPPAPSAPPGPGPGAGYGVPAPEPAPRLPAVDPETGLWTAQFLRDRLSAERARSRRSGHPCSLVLVQVPDGPLAQLPYRRQVTLLRELGYQFVAGGVVDHMVHVPDQQQHWFAVILPDSDCTGAQVLERRLRLGIGGYLASRGLPLRDLQSASLTSPDDDEAMGQIWDALIGPGGGG